MLPVLESRVQCVVRLSARNTAFAVLFIHWGTGFLLLDQSRRDGDGDGMLAGHELRISNLVPCRFQSRLIAPVLNPILKCSKLLTL